MTDKDQISSLLNQYSRTVDSGDVSGFADLYANGEWYIEGATPNRGSKEIADHVLSNMIIHEDGTPRTRHVNNNIQIDIDQEGNSAKCERYVTVLQQTDSFPLQIIVSADYSDEFARTRGNWHFTRTVIRRPFLGDISSHLKRPRRTPVSHSDIAQ